MTPQDKQKIIDTLDQLGRALVDMAEMLEVIKRVVYSDDSEGEGERET